MNVASGSSWISRRSVLQGAVFCGLPLSSGHAAAGATSGAGPADERPSYATDAKGIRIFPGQWRPHYRFEHIAWVSPAWPSQDYVWIDLPEAIFTRQGLLYLSHVNPRVQPVLFPGLARVAWEKVPGGIAYKRTLPNGVSFGAKVTVGEKAADLELSVHNGSGDPLNDIKLQTCFFLRAIAEFGAYTADNKFVHLPDLGWLAYPEACKLREERGLYRLGWRGGPKQADLPVMITRSAEGNRLIACTWGRHTYSLVCNPRHPCMHADPALPDLPPGRSATIRGRLIFFDGSPQEFAETWSRGVYQIR
jgi:hypothetical protein